MESKILECAYEMSWISSETTYLNEYEDTQFFCRFQANKTETLSTPLRQCVFRKLLLTQNN